MKSLEQSKDRQVLDRAKQRSFIQSCVSEFTETSISQGHREKVNTLALWSYLPNTISIITAGFFVIYLLQSYEFVVQIVLGFLLLGVAFSIEYGKRSLINEYAKAYFKQGKANGLLLLGLIVLFAASMSGSFVGGDRLVVSNASPPSKKISPELDSLKNEMDTLNTKIALYEGTTWKGRVTRDANKNLTSLNPMKAKLQDKIDAIEAKDNAIYTATLSQHQEKTNYFGFVLGVIAILADGLLFALLWNIKQLKHEVVLLQIEQQKPQKKAPPSEPTPTASTNVKTEIIGELGEAQTFSENQERRSIGFEIPIPKKKLEKEKSPTEFPTFPTTLENSNSKDSNRFEIVGNIVGNEKIYKVRDCMDSRKFLTRSECIKKIYHNERYLVKAKKEKTKIEIKNRIEFYQEAVQRLDKMKVQG
jgi:hypothetical protein